MLKRNMAKTLRKPCIIFLNEKTDNKTKSKSLLAERCTIKKILSEVNTVRILARFASTINKL